MRAFITRDEAGERLATALRAHAGATTLVLGIPRGGVPVAAAVARALHAELDILVAKKLGSPGQEELAMGAVTADGVRYLHEETLADLQVPDAVLAHVTAVKVNEARAQEQRLRHGRSAPAIAGRTVILVDDGLATGSTMIAAARAVRRQRPSRLVVAAPVGATSTCHALRAEADEVVCLEQPEPFRAVGLHYVDFHQVSDADVQSCLASAQPAGTGAPPA